MDCKDYLCKRCYTSHKRLKAMSKHTVVTMENILSGKVSLADEFDEICRQHDQQYRYYCKDEKKAICQDCVILKICPTEHDRITIDEAAQIKATELAKMYESLDIMKKYQEAMKATDAVEKDLKIHSQIAKDTLAKVKNQYIDLVEKTVKKYEEEIKQIINERRNKLCEKKNELWSTMRICVNNIRKNHAIRVLESGSKRGVTYISSCDTLSTQLQELSHIVQSQAADKALTYIKFETAVPEIPTMGQLLTDGTPGERWKLMGQFSTAEFNTLLGLALDQDDNIVVCSCEEGVKVFSQDGQVKCTLYDTPGAVDIAVSPDNKYHSLPKDKEQTCTHDNNGGLLHTTPLTNVNNAPSNANSLTVDKDGKIIVGQSANTISIHNADGSLISKFPTQSKPYRLAATSNREIVSSFMNDDCESGESVQLMDYSGGNTRVIQPPAEIEVWSPGFVCCRQGEIFVSNEGSGKPNGVYRYTSEGDYLGCVTMEVVTPKGIAMSKDGMKLFVADYADNCVKIFERSF